MSEMELLLTVDEMASNAWPAPVAQHLEGWRLRAAAGVSRRANSVYTAAPVPRFPAWHDEVRDFYKRQGLPPRFYMSDASPPGLDEMLAGLGYELEGSTMVQSAACDEVLRLVPPSAGIEVRFSDKVDPAWLDTFVRAEDREPATVPTYRRILEGIGPRKIFALALDDGALAGVGSAVAERGWAGLFNLAVMPDHRRKGIAAQLTRELTTWAQGNGAQNVYLQVMLNNAPALRLYERWGFTHLYDYHYRTLAQP